VRRLIPFLRRRFGQLAFAGAFNASTAHRFGSCATWAFPKTSCFFVRMGIGFKLQTRRSSLPGGDRRRAALIPTGDDEDYQEDLKLCNVIFVPFKGPFKSGMDVKLPY